MHKITICIYVYSIGSVYDIVHRKDISLCYKKSLRNTTNARTSVRLQVDVIGLIVALIINDFYKPYVTRQQWVRQIHSTIGMASHVRQKITLTAVM